MWYQVLVLWIMERGWMGCPAVSLSGEQGNSRQISKWDESVEHLADPRRIGFHPPRHNIKRLVGGLSVDARPTSTRHHEHQSTALKCNWTGAPRKHSNNQAPSPEPRELRRDQCSDNTRDIPEFTIAVRGSARGHTGTCVKEGVSCFWAGLEAAEEEEMLQSRQTMKKRQTLDDSLNNRTGQNWLQNLKILHPSKRQPEDKPKPWDRILCFTHSKLTRSNFSIRPNSVVVFAVFLFNCV